MLFFHTGCTTVTVSKCWIVVHQAHSPHSAISKHLGYLHFLLPKQHCHEHLCSERISLYVYPELRSQESWHICIFMSTKNLAEWLFHFTFPPAGIRFSLPPHPCQDLTSSPIFVSQMGVKRWLIDVLSWISLVISDYKHVFISILDHKSSSVKCLFISFDASLIGFLFISSFLCSFCTRCLPFVLPHAVVLEA